MPFTPRLLARTHRPTRSPRPTPAVTGTPALLAAVAALALAGCGPQAGSASTSSAAAATNVGLAVSNGAGNGAGSGGGAGAVPGGTRAAFTGANGEARTGGHTLQARDGRLELDGAPYDTVGAGAVSQLQVRDGRAVVTVDGQVRAADAAR